MSIALPYLSAVRITGSDAKTFLQAQLSADIGGLEDGQATFSCYCSPRGQVFGLLLVIRAADHYRMVGAASLLPGIVARLRLYVLRAEVELQPVPEWVVQGIDESASDAAAGSRSYSPPIGDLAYALVRDDESPTNGADSWKEKELKYGVAWLSPRTTERYIPQMLGFDALGAVSFSKGCYPGQEVVARAKYLGKVKRGPRTLVAESAPLAPGSTVRLFVGAESLEGTVVDSVAASAVADGSSPGSLLLIVSTEPPGPIEALEYENQTYRCATI